MTSLKVVVVDDEPLARERLSRLLREAGCEVVAELGDGPSLLAWLRSSPGEVDGLFLDIQMPGGSGLEVMAELPATPPVVFVTAFAEHAVRAFEAEAVDYVLKPVFADRLERCLARLRARQVPTRTGPELRALMPAAPQRFLVKAGVGNVFLDLKKVSHFEVLDEIVWAWAGSQRFRTQWTAIADVEAAFAEGKLLRIQRHQLLRLEAVLGYRTLPGGRWKVRVSEGVELEVSRSATPRLRERLGLG
ncbi:MAG TPA: response regulator transcription factor [Holophagaceae bacterium]|nr:response regulator transcription factor [Holophagaceae bacterium]